jgi:hypothetical protein
MFKMFKFTRIVVSQYRRLGVISRQSDFVPKLRKINGNLVVRKFKVYFDILNQSIDELFLAWSDDNGNVSRWREERRNKANSRAKTRVRNYNGKTIKLIGIVNF